MRVGSRKVVASAVVSTRRRMDGRIFISGKQGKQSIHVSDIKVPGVDRDSTNVKRSAKRMSRLTHKHVQNQVRRSKVIRKVKKP